MFYRRTAFVPFQAKAQMNSEEMSYERLLDRANKARDRGNEQLAKALLMRAMDKKGAFSSESAKVGLAPLKNLEAPSNIDVNTNYSDE